MQKLGVFWKIQDICYQMGTEIFKIEQEMTEKRKPELPTLPKKIFTATNRSANLRCDLSSTTGMVQCWAPILKCEMLTVYNLKNVKIRENVQGPKSTYNLKYH